MRYLIFFLVISGLAQTEGAAQGMVFFRGTWEEALAKAAEQDKLIFVDAYTTWCGPCKRMSATVFPDPAVGEAYNGNFICVKLDMEHEESLSFRSKHSVSAYPTLLYINAQNEVVHQVRGALQPAQLIQAGQQALAKADPADRYIEAYDNGDRSPELVYKYTQALIRSGQPHLRVANDYLRAQPDLTSAINLRYILLTATETDSRIFELLLTHRTAIAALEGDEAVKAQIWAACRNTAAKAKTFQNHALLEETWAIARQHHPNQADAFVLETEMDYCAEYHDARGYHKAARDYSRSTAVKDDAEALASLAQRTAAGFPDDSRCLDLAEESARRAAQIGNNHKYHYVYAGILSQRGKKGEALTAANRALEMAQTAGDSMAVRMLQLMIRNLENQ